MGKTLKIGHHTYEVKLVDHEVVNGTDICIATVDYHSKVIRISTLYPLDVQQEGLIHESIHALDHLYRIGLEEEEVDLLGVALDGFLKDNPNFMEVLNNKEEVKE